MDPNRRISTPSPESDTPAEVRRGPSLLERIRRRFQRRKEEEMEVPWFLDGVPVPSPGGTAEVLDEIENGSPLTPERAAMFERVERRARVRRQQEAEELPWFLDGITVLSEEGSREVLEEIKNGTPLTPERAATFERARRMAGVRKRKLTVRDQHS